MRSHRRIHMSHDEIERRRTRAEAISVVKLKAGDTGRKDQEFDFGLKGPPKGEPVEVPPVEEVQIYLCAGCQQEILKDQPACLTCGQKMDWEGIENVA